MNDQPDAMNEPAPPSRRRRIRRNFVRSAAGVSLVASIAVGSFLLKPYYGSNLGIVDPGRVIRSAQPTSGLKDMIRDHKLASILSLRGGSLRDWYYSNEVGVAKEAGVDFYDLSMSATKRPKRSDLLRLIDVMNRCKYPLLIHCKAGADRTGLASAIYRMVVLKEPPETAVEAFTIYHSHVPLFGTQQLHEPIDEYAAWLAQNALPHTPERFRDWVMNTYRADDPAVEPPPVLPGPRHALQAEIGGHSG
ncbi:fused DSP-PTPase phosphatase/NAD kinase-like protein [Paludisphaera borealis]|uniref:Tyrosine specific protein phosphatases domain-containing protein n=1 Tax=Paludisphaera borealis TaxID=1387353 RepID=A0A1U7CYH2_9BACT|nr:tyrosine-protein phosphatase [Paludisphaera borealis]APW63938.1 hypothetical protein BSF38_05526 [Paludisphaera borealis]